MNRKALIFAMTALSLCAAAAFGADVSRMKREIAQADYHLKEFEN